jgi:xanthine dehydrogenase molybdenum-binding subunit
MANFIEVEVDTETGIVEIISAVTAYDGGVIVNPLTAEMTGEAGWFWGTSTAFTEDLVTDEETGVMLNPNLLEYKMMTHADWPSLKAIFAEEAYEPMGVYGSKGLGESSPNGQAAALLNAICNAIGARIREYPATPDRILKALGKI